MFRAPDDEVPVTDLTHPRILARGLNRQLVQFDADKRLHQIRQLDRKEPDAAIHIDQVPHAAFRDALSNGFHQLRQQKEIVLEEF